MDRPEAIKIIKALEELTRAVKQQNLLITELGRKWMALNDTSKEEPSQESSGS